MSFGRFSPAVWLLRAAGLFGENQLANAVGETVQAESNNAYTPAC